LIEDLQKAICDFISHKKHCSAKEALEHVRKLGITGEQELQLEDLQTVIDTLVYDALLEKHFEPRLNHEVYMFASVLTPENSFSTIPCSTCPVFEQCTDQGDINPQTCPYLAKWLQYNVDDGLNS
jgi:DNA-directed RNA polymerase III subunit RPC6